jgi:hypothetical protein
MIHHLSLPIVSIFERENRDNIVNTNVARWGSLELSQLGEHFQGIRIFEYKESLKSANSDHLDKIGKSKRE